eukprot:4544304-Pleurochrysis_carterae.AAC.1
MAALRAHTASPNSATELTCLVPMVTLPIFLPPDARNTAAQKEKKVALPGWKGTRRGAGGGVGASMRSPVDGLLCKSKVERQREGICSSTRRGVRFEERCRHCCGWRVKAVLMTGENAL